jgi:hypothetical protein
MFCWLVLFGGISLMATSYLLLQEEQGHGRKRIEAWPSGTAPRPMPPRRRTSKPAAPDAAEVPSAAGGS